MIKTVARISAELAFGTEEVIEGETYLTGGIHGTTPEGSIASFNVEEDADGNLIISTIMAQYLEPTQFTPILYNPIIDTQ